jgi:hypothetical protein
MFVTILYAANGDRAVAKEYFEVFCGGSIARMDDFKTLSLSPTARRRHSKAAGTKANAERWN